MIVNIVCITRFLVLRRARYRLSQPQITSFETDLHEPLDRHNELIEVGEGDFLDMEYNFERDYINDLRLEYNEVMEYAESDGSDHKPNNANNSTNDEWVVHSLEHVNDDK